MPDQHFTKTILTDRSPEEVFSAINRVQDWWSQDFEGQSEKPGDEFSVRFGDLHYSRHKLMETVPLKTIVWLVTDSRLSFLQDKSEWTGTENRFEISGQDNGPGRRQTRLVFTHIGLVPGIECFQSCSGGWTYYLDSLESLINTGLGRPYEPAV